MPKHSGSEIVAAGTRRIGVCSFHVDSTSPTDAVPAIAAPSSTKKSASTANATRQRNGRALVSARTGR